MRQVVRAPDRALITLCTAVSDLTAAQDRFCAAERSGTLAAGMTARARLTATIGLPVAFAVAVGFASTAEAGPTGELDDAPVDDEGLAAGRAIWLGDCAICHGEEGTGSALAPSLQGVGAAGVHFDVSTGRMPLDEPDQQAARGPVAYEPAEIDALVAYARTIIEGPDVPEVDLSAADIAKGGELYRLNCATCHQVVGQGGILTSGPNVPPLGPATALQVVEAMRAGPNDMPQFPEDVIDEDGAANIAAYLQEIDDPRDRGGWPLGHWGPVPEGAVAFVLGLVPVILVARWLGERQPPPAQELESS
jgi:ubiquinol-cytochrome c reductase cytochrome c subunit